MVGSSKPYIIVSYCCIGENSLLIIPFNLWSNFMLWYSRQSFSTYLRNAYRDVPDSALRIQLWPGLAEAVPSQNVCSGCKRKTVNKKQGMGGDLPSQECALNHSCWLVYWRRTVASALSWGVCKSPSAKAGEIPLEFLQEITPPSPPRVSSLLGGNC